MISACFVLNATLTLPASGIVLTVGMPSTPTCLIYERIRRNCVAAATRFRDRRGFQARGVADSRFQITLHRRGGAVYIARSVRAFGRNARHRIITHGIHRFTLPA